MVPEDLTKNKINRVADFFIEKATSNSRQEETLTNLKLQKLLYYAHVWWIVETGGALFEEPVCAKESGPVFLSQYKRFKKYKSKAIPAKAIRSSIDLLSMKLRNFLEDIWGQYGIYTSNELTRRVHQESPWLDSFTAGKEITLSSITWYYDPKRHLPKSEGFLINLKE